MAVIRSTDATLSRSLIDCRDEPSSAVVIARQPGWCAGPRRTGKRMQRELVAVNDFNAGKGYLDQS